MEQRSIKNGGLFPACRRACGAAWDRIAPLLAGDAAELARAAGEAGLPFLPDLARLELARAELAAAPPPERAEAVALNSTLRLLEVSWRNLPALLAGEARAVAGKEQLLLWKDLGGEVRLAPAREDRLLALKIAAEGLDPEQVAAAGGVPVGGIDAALDRAAAEALLLAPRSRIRRQGETFHSRPWPEEQLAADTFTLQWHVTQECDLHCRHCYDRSQRGALPLSRGMEILRELRRFCRERFVTGQVSFTGGNPFLSPDFDALYRAAAELGLAAAILGNPVPRERLERVLAVARPVYFQVSLEGLAEHNDLIRGRGNFARVFAFLDQLAELGIFSVVMLTLTRDNLRQVLPLAELLRGRAGRFAFNRLAPFGEGADLAPAERDEFAAFLREYRGELERNPDLGRKDSLLNLVHRERGEEPFGGCTGYGCGAAFNFVTLLADGEVHACRKFPSPIGNLLTGSLAEIYDSAPARRYRAGSAGCAGCDLRAVCGGCLAVTAGLGRDPFTEKDPYCFLDT
ncbi:MAG: thio(seleno)oxazole modification radical SAM maturase SbtM [Geobacteraceae bacterium]|nr:thio(seleno)oxazole modification radical SAM maturase SbtM [Geobacteraceae bacterium]